MPLEPATNAILIEATKTLQNKSESDRSEFEAQIFARLGELKTLIERGNRLVDHCVDQLKLARERTLKACGAYENTADMLATYYAQKRAEEEERRSEIAEAFKAGEKLAQELLEEIPIEIKPTAPVETKNNQP